MEKITNHILHVGLNQINSRLTEWTAEMLEGGPLVELRALAEPVPTARSVEEKRLMATTLAIQMDPRAAIELCWRIRELALTKGWSLQQ